MADLEDPSAIVGVGPSRSPVGRAARWVARALAVTREGARDEAWGGVVAMRERADGAWGEPSALMSSSSPDRLDGPSAVGGWVSVRGGRDRPQVPAVGTLSCGPVAVSVSGRPVASDGLRRAMLSAGAVLPDRSASGLILSRMGRSSKGRALHKLIDALWDIPGGYAALMACPELLVAVRDPMGLRPLVWGRVEDTEVFASDPVAVLRLGGQIEREVAPGEMVVVDERGVSFLHPFRSREPRPCGQLWWQLGADGVSYGGASVRGVREQIAHGLAPARPDGVEVVVAADADVVAPAQWLAHQWGSRWVPGRTADGRTVVEDVQERAVALVARGGAGGVALREAVDGLLQAGAREVHLRLLAPRPVRSCPYGWRGPSAELLTEATLCRRWGLASVAWPDRAAASEAVLARSGGRVTPCQACVGGDLPVDPEPTEDQLSLFGEDEEI